MGKRDLLAWKSPTPPDKDTPAGASQPSSRAPSRYLARLIFGSPEADLGDPNNDFPARILSTIKTQSGSGEDSTSTPAASISQPPPLTQSRSSHPHCDTMRLPKRCARTSSIRSKQRSPSVPPTCEMLASLPLHPTISTKTPLSSPTTKTIASCNIGS